MSKRVVIIGGGISGLAAAYSIREHESASGSVATPYPEVLLIEKGDRIGGNIRTERIDGFVVEAGPDCFISEKPWAMALCKRIGLEERLLPTNDEFRKTYVLSRDRLHELPEGVILMIPTRMLPLATSTLISIPGKIRMALEYFIPKKKDPGDESLGAFVRRRLGSEALEKIAEPLIAGIHSGDPDAMSIRSTFPKFVELEEEHGSLIRGMLKRMARMKKSRGKQAAGKPPPGAPKKKVTMFMSLEGGMGELVTTLTARLAAFKDTRVLTRVVASKVVKRGEKYEITVEGGEPIEADCVVIAAPAFAAAPLVEDLDSPLAEKLRTIPYVSTATVSVAFRAEDVTHPMDGFGFVIPRVENRRIMASTWTSVKFSHRAPEGTVLIRCFVGGAKRSELVSLNDTELIRLVREELR
ncbi:MAG: protoporphyrinogen oxidase, partial [Thermodesulfobacteriota bacterium]